MDQKMERLIFLDFDGVLNSGIYLRGLPARDVPVNDIDPVAVARLNRIIEAVPGTSVVISSTWRQLYRQADLRGFLNARGFRGEMIGVTPYLGTERGIEIASFLNGLDERPIGIAILDDSGDMAHLTPYLVDTDFEWGLCEEHVGRAIDMLGRRYPPEDDEICDWGGCVAMAKSDDLFQDCHCVPGCTDQVFSLGSFQYALLRVGNDIVVSKTGNRVHNEEFRNMGAAKKWVVGHVGRELRRMISEHQVELSRLE